MEVLKAILPLLILGAIVVYVILGLKRKQIEGKLGKKNTTGEQVFLDSLIPLGLIFGCAIGVLVGIFFPFSLLTSLSIGAGFGYLLGYFAYDRWSKKETYS